MKRSGASRLATWAKNKPVLVGSIVVLTIYLVDLGVVDRWQVGGVIQAANTHDGIAGAWVVADFRGDELLLNSPFQPHPKHPTSKCMGTRLAVTDQYGRFRFNLLTLNRPLTHKRAKLLVFKPGWISHADSSPIKSSLFALDGGVPIALTRGPGASRSTRSFMDQSAAALQPAEKQRSDELFKTLRALSQIKLMCEYQPEVAVAAMTHALNIAQTFDERERARSACRGVTRRLASLEDKHEWPFDCDNLAFKHEPSAAALALEAELEAKRRRWRELHPEDGS